MTADDQRGAYDQSDEIRVEKLLAERDRLRAELAETRAAGEDPWLERYEQALGELSAQVARLRIAGDALAAAGRELYDSKTWSGKALTDARQAFIDAHAGWRSVRGDAPTQPLRDGQARVRLGEHGIEIVPDATAPADDTAAPDGMSLDRFAAMPREQAREWIEERHAEHRRLREAECDANGRHLVLEADTSHCGHCDRLYADIAGGSSPASTDDTGCQPPHGPDERCLDCATDDEVLDAVPPWPGTPASTDGGEG